VKIGGFVHKGLKRLYLEDSPKGLPPEAVAKLRAMLTFLQDMQDPATLTSLSSVEGARTHRRSQRDLESARYP
jgi:toxin HigB-1